MRERQILIAGGGIGGLSAALLLADQGYEVTVFEQAQEFSDIGAGIQLSPNATRVLFKAGLEEALREIAFVPEGGEMRHWQNGSIISTTALGKSVSRDFGFPYFHVHRADLIGVLVDAASRLPNIRLRGQTRVSEVKQSGNGVTVTLDNGEATRGDILIGADGIRSIVRSFLFGDAAPEFTGNVAWRALVPADRLPPGLIKPMASVWWGPGAHFVHYFVRRGEFVNCVCVVEKAGWKLESWKAESWKAESWTEPGQISELQADFADWHPDIQLLIDKMNPESLYKWALFDRAPMQRWGRGRTTLLGDACHPTLPFMAQGAAMAIEDGAVLTRCLLEQGSLEVRLRRYEDLRRDRTARVQMGSRRNAKLFHMRGLQAGVRNFAARTAGKNAPKNMMKWLFGYNAFTAHEEQ